ncbi:MAG: antibiotic biosynthesis monooxygenase [Endozoicomonadaceae bacterium]|nr:antibiotic biosynthesis monooxygenase [Endozoicomonadaceae bacterium]
MYAVIFRAKTEKLDDTYAELAKRMRELAIQKYNCSEFTAVTEGTSEIAISYWKSLSDIKVWKQDSEHLVAQEMGKKKWYKSYRVQVVEILREYEKQ